MFFITCVALGFCLFFFFFFFYRRSCFSLTLPVFQGSSSLRPDPPYPPSFLLLLLLLLLRRLCRPQCETHVDGEYENRIYGYIYRYIYICIYTVYMVNARRRGKKRSLGEILLGLRCACCLCWGRYENFISMR